MFTLGPDGVLTGSAREAQKLQEETGEALRNNAISMKDREIDRKRKVLEAKISSLQTEFESAEEELNKIYIRGRTNKKGNGEQPAGNDADKRGETMQSG